ncbi:hypothetical protein BCY86_00825 [Pajaroellobacter abortibovis]|uniref:Uncharacterized protein n=1 Tax=Pajaroellobacter abortibovis TaxID=1882918 RepID=A0A1L6MV43_9BACT|nr:hypothetical protein BCY86_00825 [Pajaroellobacter abortibovis]
MDLSLHPIPTLSRAHRAEVTLAPLSQHNLLVSLITQRLREPLQNLKAYKTPHFTTEKAERILLHFFDPLNFTLLAKTLAEGKCGYIKVNSKEAFIF